MAAKKKLGIIERLKQAKTIVEVTKLTKEAEDYENIDPKTLRKFTKISKKKRAEIKIDAATFLKKRAEIKKKS